jgi:hypothetical protein
MQIAVDKNQFTGSHGRSNKQKHKAMEAMGVELLPLPLPFGDYCLVNDDIQAVLDEKGDKVAKKDLLNHIKVSIDTKKSIEEIWGNVHGSQHERFRRELLKPINTGAKLIILIEHGSDVRCLEDVYFFYQPEMVRYRWTTQIVCGKPTKVREQYKQKPIKGDSLYRALCTIRDRYNVDFVFCTKEETGRKIVEILSNDQ